METDEVARADIAVGAALGAEEKDGKRKANANHRDVKIHNYDQDIRPFSGRNVSRRMNVN